MRNYCTGDTLDSVMNYPLREAILSFCDGQERRCGVGAAGAASGGGISRAIPVMR